MASMSCLYVGLRVLVYTLGLAHEEGQPRILTLIIFWNSPCA